MTQVETNWVVRERRRAGGSPVFLSVERQEQETLTDGRGGRMRAAYPVGPRPTDVGPSRGFV